jgi:membrane protein DedA with SNARE-associated domain
VLEELARIWVQWGALAYFAAATWAFFEGETFVLFAAALGAKTDLVDPWLLIISVWIGSYAGDQLWFFLGKRYGAKAVKRIPGGEKQLGRASALLERYGNAFVLTFRFIYGVRNVASAACGAAGMSHTKFAVLNFIAAGLWAATFVAAGWFALELVGEDNLIYLLFAAGVVILTIVVLRARARNRREAAEAAAAPTSPPAG